MNIVVVASRLLQERVSAAQQQQGIAVADGALDGQQVPDLDEKWSTRLQAGTFWAVESPCIHPGDPPADAARRARCRRRDYATN